MYKWVLVTEQLGQGAAEITSIDVFFNFFLNTHKRALATCMFLLTYKRLAFIFYSEHVKAKKITVKPLKINGHTSRNTTWSKASFASPCIINNFVGIKNSKG